ncbi:MAG: hypothetical protein WBB82_10805 [Limnothrix sp.]
MANQTIIKLDPKTNVSNKKACKDKIKAQIDLVDARMDEFRAKANQAEAKGRIQYNEVLEDLSSKRETAQQKLDELQDSSEAAWDNISEGFENAWRELEHSFKKASSHF